MEAGGSLVACARLESRGKAQGLENTWGNRDLNSSGSGIPCSIAFLTDPLPGSRETSHFPRSTAGADVRYVMTS